MSSEREGSNRHAVRVAESFAHLAAGLAGREPDADLLERFQRTESLCKRAVAENAPAELNSLLPKLQAALQTWQEVWPRLGTQREFRQAVAREADLWSRRLTALAKQA